MFITKVAHACCHLVQLAETTSDNKYKARSGQAFAGYFFFFKKSDLLSLEAEPQASRPHAGHYIYVHYALGP